MGDVLPTTWLPKLKYLMLWARLPTGTMRKGRRVLRDGRAGRQDGKVVAVRRRVPLPGTKSSLPPFSFR